MGVFLRIIFLGGLLHVSLISDGAPELQEGSVIRDSEIEAYMHEYMDPLFKVAGLNPRELKIILLIDKGINAAATLNYTVIIYTGLLSSVKKPSELAGVLAHETGHIKGGHMIRMEGAIRNAQNTSLIASIVGLALGVLTGNAGAGMGVLAGAQAHSLGGFLRYRRHEEGAADQAAIKYLKELKWPIQGFLDLMELLEGQLMLTANYQQPYLLTHPLTRDRIQTVRSAVKSRKEEGGTNDKMPEIFDSHLRRMQAKLAGFLWPPMRALKEYKGDRTEDLYARAIAYYRLSEFKDSLHCIETLIEREPNNPYFWELSGQISFDKGDLPTAEASYRKALHFRKEDPQFLVSLSHVLLSKEDKSYLDEVILLLTRATVFEPSNSTPWHFLAIAYGRKGMMGFMALSLAEHAYRSEDWGYAKSQAGRAKSHLKKTSPAYMRAADIEMIATRQLSNEKSLFEG